MKKIKKLSSLLAAVAVLLSSVVISTTVSAEDTYITHEVIDDIYNTGETTAISYTKNEAGADYLQKLYIKADTNIGLPSGKYGMFPYVHRVDGQDIPVANAVWYSENGMDTFFMDALLMPEKSSDDFVKSSYSFYYSSDNKNWTLADFSIGASEKKDATWFVTRRITVSDLPAGTKYVKFLSLNVNSTKGISYCMGFVRTGYTYKELVVDPIITAEYKNFYGVYANTLNNGAEITRDARIKIANVSDPKANGKVLIKKNGSSVEAADYYNSAESAYEFTESGEYEITASNVSGSASFSFRLQKVAEDTVAIRTVVDDIYNTGKTTAYYYTSYYADASHLYSLGITKDTNVLPSGKYCMRPYVHNYSEPKVYAIWKSDMGMGSFWVDAFLNPSSCDETFIRNSYKLYYSYDNEEWIEADFSIGEKRTEDASWFVTRRLTADKIPDGVKYVKYQSLCVDSTKNIGYMMGIVRSGYTVYVLEPKINANAKDILGYYQTPVGDGATVPSEVQVEFVDVTDAGGSYTIKKDGSDYALPSDSILTENGTYEITAVNSKGTETLTFTIDTSKATDAAFEKYDFSSGLESASEAYESLLGITPAGASADFTKGDGHIIVNDTAASKNQDATWWGLNEGRTKLTVGSDARGYTKDGYFYFVNQGSDGTKYTGFSITYTVGEQSGYPRDAYFSVYTADTYNGGYRLVEPSYIEKEPYNGSAAVARYHATYYLGAEASVVKIEFHPQAPDVASAYWQGTFLSILDLTKLSTPYMAVATVDGNRVVDNQVLTGNARISVSNAMYYFVEKDGKSYATPANGILTEDGYYTVTAGNAAGSASVSFYIAKKMPAIQLIDSFGNYLPDGSVATDDVKAVFYNADEIKTTLNDELYSTSSEQILDLNGKYVLTAKNAEGSFSYELQLSRPLPTLKAYNFQGTQVKEGDKIVTSVTFSMATYDSFAVTLNGKPISVGDDFKLTEEGEYVIEVVNKAGKTTLGFTLKYNPPLPTLTHAGDTVVSLDYHTIGASKWNSWMYKYENYTMDNGTALQSTWTGFTGPTVRPTVKDDSECYVIYKAPGFKSFHYYTAMSPSHKKSVDEVYSIYVSKDGRTYDKVDYTVEHDISYITVGWKLYRLVPESIPEGTKYIKVAMDMTGATAPYDTATKLVEFSYDKENYGKLDLDDILFMTEDAIDGDTVKIDFYNDGVVIPKEVFESINGTDITIDVNLYNKQTDKLEYVLDFNGMNIEEPMDFNTGVLKSENSTLKAVKASDSNAIGYTFSQASPWTMAVDFQIHDTESLKGGVYYAMYGYADNALVFISKQRLFAKGSTLTFSLTDYPELALSELVDLIKNSDEDEDYEDKDNYIDNSDDISEENTGNTEDEPIYMMTVNRRKKLSIASSSGILVPIIIIAAAVVVIAAAAVVLIILAKKGIIFKKKGV